MLPGPTIIKKCSICSGLIEQETIISGNTFGAMLWTDGSMEAHMLPEQLWLVKCPHCKALLWIDELEKVGEIDKYCYSYDYNNEDAKFKGRKPYEVPNLIDYFAKFKESELNKEKELYLRLHAWWFGNDKRRYCEDTKENLSNEEKENLKALFKILDSSIDNERLMMAEIKRELGDFEGAITLLNKPFPRELSSAAFKIRILAMKQDPFVAEI